MKRFQILALVGVVVLLSAGGLSVSAQAPQPQTPPPGPPAVTFQVEVNFVDVDAVVTDQQGNFVSDLKKEDFEVFEDGKPQKIDTFSLVEIPLERQDRFRFIDRPITADVRSNRRPFDGRLYVIVLDDLDVSPIRTGMVREDGSAVHREEFRRQRRRFRRLHERPHRCDAGFHERSSAAAGRDR